MSRDTTPPHCEWPRSVCNAPPTKHEKNGASFCEEHYKAWAQVMQGMIDAYK